MNSNYIEISGHAYAIDLDKFMDFITSSDNVVQQISQAYGVDNEGNMILLNKDVSETKENVGEGISEIRFNVLNNILNLLLIPISDGNGVILTHNIDYNMNLGQKLAFNTLVEMGIIYEIELDK